jgi:hypothetical protein
MLWPKRVSGNVEVSHLRHVRVGVLCRLTREQWIEAVSTTLTAIDVGLFLVWYLRA